MFLNFLQPTFTRKSTRNTQNNSLNLLRTDPRGPRELREGPQGTPGTSTKQYVLVNLLNWSGASSCKQYRMLLHRRYAFFCGTRRYRPRITGINGEEARAARGRNVVINTGAKLQHCERKTPLCSRTFFAAPSQSNEIICCISLLVSIPSAKQSSCSKECHHGWPPRRVHQWLLILKSESMYTRCQQVCGGHSKCQERNCQRLALRIIAGN